MTLAVDEFLRRFLLHLLPPGYVRIRNFGFLANRNRATLLPLCFQLLGGIEKTTASETSPTTNQIHSLWNCPVCGGTMRVVERLSAAQLLPRSPRNAVKGGQDPMRALAQEWVLPLYQAHSHERQRCDQDRCGSSD